MMSAENPGMFVDVHRSHDMCAIWNIMGDRHAGHAERALGLARACGIARARDFKAAGIPLVYLTRLVDAGALIRLGRGLYQMPDRVGEHAAHDLAEAARLMHAAPDGHLSTDVTRLVLSQPLTILCHDPCKTEGLRITRSASVRTLARLILIIALLAGMGSGIFHIRQALASTGMRRTDMLAAGVDMLPVGTAKQIDRLKRIRLQKP